MCDTHPEIALPNALPPASSGFLLASRWRTRDAGASVHQLDTRSAQLQLHVPVDWFMASRPLQ